MSDVYLIVEQHPMNVLQHFYEQAPHPICVAWTCVQHPVGWAGGDSDLAGNTTRAFKVC